MCKKKAWLKHKEEIFSASVEALEEIAKAAQRNSILKFGKVIGLYTPLYLSNYCENLCIYCGFHAKANIDRHRLSPEEIVAELEAIYITGIREVLLLTGEHATLTSPLYIANAAHMARSIGFKSVGVEVYPMSVDEYAMMASAGVNSLSLYQETYNRQIYSAVHLDGPKSDYDWRLGAPSRAAQAGIPQINIGALFGLAPFEEELFALCDHLSSLMQAFPSVEWGLSIPRLQGATPWVDTSRVPISDIQFIKIYLTLRRTFPSVTISISTRESQLMRRHLITMGINKLSAGVKTTVGGYSNGDKSDAQFPIRDGQSVVAVTNVISEMGYQPVFTNWFGRGLEFTDSIAHNKLGANL